MLLAYTRDQYGSKFNAALTMSTGPQAQDQ